MNVSQNAKVLKTMSDLGGIIENLLLLLSDKEKFVINKRFDLDSSGRMTLEEIGQGFSVTRERIRQIERNALQKMKRNVFNTALKDLHEFISLEIDAKGGFLREKDLNTTLSQMSNNMIDVSKNHIHLAYVLHDNLDCIGNTINYYPYIKSKNVPDYSLKFLSNKVINHLNKKGDVQNIEDLHSDFSKTMEDLSFNLDSFKSLVSVDKRLTMVDDYLLGLIEWRHIHPRTLREKVMFILKREKKPLHFTDISDYIASLKFDDRPVNLQAVHNELIRHDNFVLIGRGIYALKEWGYEKGTVIDVIERVLSENGDLSTEEIVDSVLQRRQIKKITILLALKNCKKFERIGRKRYALKCA